MLMLAKYSIGVGDRFAHQSKAQLRACLQAAEKGIDVIPVWNKSHREHAIVGSQPASVRVSANAAVRELGWNKPYHVDADHIRLETVDGFLPSADFFTIDVAESIGQPAEPSTINGLIDRHPELNGRLEIPGIQGPFATTRADVENTAGKYLRAIQEAGKIYRHIAKAKGAGNFITEISIDETDNPQTPPELLVILAAIADEKLPIQTIAPKFTGRFNKGVDYVGNIEEFEKEFSDDLAIIAFATQKYGLPSNLKLSVHSGSDKFSIYAAIARSIAKFDAGLHLKTAGTSWLEEVVGLAEAGGQGLELAKEIYVKALDKLDALCAPYAAVIDIDARKLPPAEAVWRWSSEQYVAALRHDALCPSFNSHLRQLIHVGYKIAAQMGDRYLKMLDACESTISRNVTENLFERHMKPLFLSRSLGV
jgi:tagaturonate epimerase